MRSTLDISRAPRANVGLASSWGAPEPAVSFGNHCAYEPAAVRPLIGQYITPSLPFTHAHCLENWDSAARVFTITAASAQGWDYQYFLQAANVIAPPVAVSDPPFTVVVNSALPHSPGMLGLLAIFTPTMPATDTLRETLRLTATSAISPAVRASAFSVALAPGYRIDEPGRGSSVYLPLIFKDH